MGHVIVLSSEDNSEIGAHVYRENLNFNLFNPIKTGWTFPPPPLDFKLQELFNLYLFDHKQEKYTPFITPDPLIG